MKNYNEILANTTTIEEVKNIVKDINNNIKDNNKDFEFNFLELKSAIENINKENRKEYTVSFCYNMDNNRQYAFTQLLNKPYFDTYSVNFNEKTREYEIIDKTSLFSFKDLEKGYQIHKSTDNDTKGNPILNKDVTIFDALRFYGLSTVFIRNLQKANFEIDKDNGYNLENIVVDGEKLFKDIDGKCFASNSNNSLEKQLNIIVKFFGYDVQMLKKDLPILKIKAQKIKQDKTNAKYSVNAIIDDNSILKFADVIFGVVASRIHNEDIDIVTSKPTKED